MPDDHSFDFDAVHSRESLRFLQSEEGLQIPGDGLAHRDATCLSESLPPLVSHAANATNHQVSNNDILFLISICCTSRFFISSRFYLPHNKGYLCWPTPSSRSSAWSTASGSAGRKSSPLSATLSASATRARDSPSDATKWTLWPGMFSC